MTPKATTVRAYLAALPADRREALETILGVLRKSAHKDFEEGMQYGMPAFYLPHSKYPAGYHCDPRQPLPFLSVASQKNHIGLYLFCMYTSEEVLRDFKRDWLASGKKLDMGKSCVRVKKLEDVPLDVLGRAIKGITAKQFVATYEAARDGSGFSSKAKQRAGAGKKAAGRTAAKKSAKRAPARKA